MSKDAYYFPHDSNARHDPKMVAMISVYGMQGYGHYWSIIEILREQKGYAYPLDTKYAYNSLASETQTDVGTIKEFIGDCVNEFQLLSIGDDGLYSESLNNRMSKLDKKRAQATAAANARWDKNKKPEEKPKPDKPIDPAKVKNKSVLTNDRYWDLFAKELLSTKEFSSIGRSILDGERNKCLDWSKSKAKVQKDYRAFFRNWMRSWVNYNGSNNKSKKGMVF